MFCLKVCIQELHICSKCTSVGLKISFDLVFSRILHQEMPDMQFKAEINFYAVLFSMSISVMLSQGHMRDNG